MTYVLLFLFLSGSAWQDLRTGRISNCWIALWVVCFMAAILIRGPSDWLRLAAEAARFLFLIFFTIAFFFLLFLCRMMGAGDIKVMALIVGFLGFFDGIAVLIYGLAVSAAWSFLYMIHEKILIQRISYFAGYLNRCIRMRQVVPYLGWAKDGAERKRSAASFCFVPFLWSGFLIWIAGQGGVI